MRALDALRLAAGGLRERKTRTALTLLGILIGTAVIVGLVSASQGQSAAIGAQLSKLGPTTLILRPDGGRTFTLNDVMRAQGVTGVVEAVPAVTGSALALHDGQNISVSILGVDPTKLPDFVKGVSIADGSVIGPEDLTSVDIGATVAQPTTSTTPLAGVGDVVQLQVTTRNPIRAQGVPAFTASTHTVIVAGVAAPFGSAPFVNVDTTVFMTPRAAQQMLRTNSYNEIIVLADSPADVNGVQAALASEFANQANVISGTQLAATIQSVFTTIGLLLGSIAGISLVVAGVGIANTMFVSVLERTTEIGVMKSLGFKARNILSVFLLEAGLTGLLGGILGCLAGAGLSFALTGLLSGGGIGGLFGRGGGGARAASSPAPTAAPGGGAGAFRGGGGFGSLNVSGSPVFTWQLFALVILFAVVIAMLAGLIPARKAARMQPVVALKRL